MSYEVTYLTVNGHYAIPAETLEEAEIWATKIKELNKLPGNMALGVKVVEL